MRILTWEHKHGTEYYDASTDEALQKSARQVIKELLEFPYICEPEHPTTNIEYSGIDLDLANLSEELIDALPTDGLREQARKEKAKLTRRYREYDNDKLEYETFRKVAAGETVMGGSYVRRTDSRDGKYRAGDTVPPREITPWELLQTRNGYEYEVFDIAEVWTPDA